MSSEDRNERLRALSDEIAHFRAVTDRRLTELEAQIASLLADGAESSTAPPVSPGPPGSAPAKPTAPGTPPAPDAGTPAPPPARAKAWQQTPPMELPRAMREWTQVQRPTFDLPQLTGPRAIAVLGGAVLLLGIVLLFAIAVNRGWVSPWLRCAIGALASAGVLAAAFWARRRFGRNDSSLAAAGVGFSGLYVSLAAATMLYDLLSAPVALAGVVLIAAAAVATASRWKSQLVATNGLAAALVAGPLATQSLDADVVGLSVLILAAGTVVCLRERWRRLLVASLLLVAPQIAVVGLVRVDDGVFAEHVLATWLTLCGFAALVLVTGVAVRLHPRPDDAKGRTLGLTLVLLSFPVTLGALAAATDAANGHGIALGVALLVPVAVYLAGATILIRERLDPALQSALLGAGTGLSAIAAASALGGATLALVFALEALIATAVAWRSRESRLLLAAAVYLALGIGHVLTVDVPARRLVEWDEGLPGRAWLWFPLAVAAWALARVAQRDTGVNLPRRLRVWADANDLTRAQVVPLLDLVGATAAITGLSFYTLALGHSWFDADEPTPFLQVERAHILVSGLLVAIAVGLYVLARGQLWRWYAVGLFGLTALKIAGIDNSGQRSWHWVVSVAVLATGLLAASTTTALRRRDNRGRIWPAADVAGLLAVPGLGAIVGFELPRWWAPAPTTWLLLADQAVVLSIVFVLLLRRRARDPLTAVWVGSSFLAGLALADGLLAGHRNLFATGFVVLALHLLAGAVRLRDPRFALGAAASLAAGLLFTVGALATPRDLLTEVGDPASSLHVLAFGIAALVALLVSRPLTRRPQEDRDRFDDRLAEAADEATRTGAWLAGGLALYALGLAVLGLAQVLPGNLGTNFQRGQAVVSGVWAVVGLALLYTGLFRRSRSLRVGGLGILGLSVVKLFVFDSSQLSSLARAFSFMAVGAILLVAGLVYTRLSSDLRERERATALPGRPPS